MSVTPGSVLGEVDPLIRRAERFAGIGDVLAWQQMAEFALGLSMGSGNLEIDPAKDHPEAFMLGARCGQVLSMRIPEAELTAQVGTYLGEKLTLMQTALGDDWQWSDAFPASDGQITTE